MARPHQSQVAKQEAQEAIDRKLAVLRDWAANGIPYRQDHSGHVLVDSDDRKVMEYFPTSLRQFKQWDGSQNCARVRAQLPVLAAIGNDTLAKRPASAEQAARLIEALRERARTQRDANLSSVVQRLEQELRVANQIIGLRVAEIREQQRRARHLERENARLVAKQDGDKEEFGHVLEQTRGQLEQERQRNAELTALLAKISPLRRAHDDN